MNSLGGRKDAALSSQQEFTPKEASDLGAFTEDALTAEDAEASVNDKREDGDARL